MKKSTLWILSALAVAAVLAGGARWASQRQATPAATAPNAAAVPSIELAASDVFTARTQTLSLGIAVSGALKASQSAFVKARVAGELQELSVREGDRVQAGQVIARIDPTEYPGACAPGAAASRCGPRTRWTVAQRQFDNNQALVEPGLHLANRPAHLAGQPEWGQGHACGRAGRAGPGQQVTGRCHAARAPVGRGGAAPGPAR